MFSFQFVLNAAVICFCLVLAKNQVYRFHEMYLDYRRDKINKKYWELQEKRKNNSTYKVKNSSSNYVSKNKNQNDKVCNTGFLKIFNPET